MSASLDPVEARARPFERPPESALRRFVDHNRAALGTLAVFVVMIAIFMAASPRVFLHWPIYDSVLVTLPVALCLVVPLVFVVTVGEIDLSFPATMGFSAWTFALIVHAGLSPFLGIVAALLTGMALGACVGALVVTAGLSSLIATLGMNYMLRGFIMIVTQGNRSRCSNCRTRRRARCSRDKWAAFQSRSSGRSPSSPSPAFCSTITNLGPACERSATIRTARDKWASTSRASAS